MVTHMLLCMYHVVGNLGGSYIVRFYEKITSFLLAELNILLFDSVCGVTPMCWASISALEAKSLTTSFSFWVQDGDGLGTHVSCKKYLKSAIFQLSLLDT